MGYSCVCVGVYISSCIRGDFTWTRQTPAECVITIMLPTSYGCLNSGFSNRSHLGSSSSPSAPDHLPPALPSSCSHRVITSKIILSTFSKNALRPSGELESAVLVSKRETPRVLGALDGPGGGRAGAAGAGPELEDADLVGVVAFASPVVLVVFRMDGVKYMIGQNLHACAV